VSFRPGKLYNLFGFSSQLMIAQLIGGDTKADDPNQRSKIQKVMDITGMAEDAVATALFDAAWDEQKAIELLLVNFPIFKA